MMQGQDRMKSYESFSAGKYLLEPSKEMYVGESEIYHIKRAAECKNAADSIQPTKER